MSELGGRTGPSPVGPTTEDRSGPSTGSRSRTPKSGPGGVEIRPLLLRRDRPPDAEELLLPEGHAMDAPRTIRQAVTDQVGTDDIAKASSPSTKMALALAATGRRVYEGTVPAAVVARRRAKSRRARIARRAAR